MQGLRCCASAVMRMWERGNQDSEFRFEGLRLGGQPRTAAPVGGIQDACSSRDSTMAPSSHIRQGFRAQGSGVQGVEHQQPPPVPLPLTLNPKSCFMKQACMCRSGLDTGIRAWSWKGRTLKTDWYVAFPG